MQSTTHLGIFKRKTQRVASIIFGKTPETEAPKLIVRMVMIIACEIQVITL